MKPKNGKAVPPHTDNKMALKQSPSELSCMVDKTFKSHTQSQFLSNKNVIEMEDNENNSEIASPVTLKRIENPYPYRPYYYQSY